MKKIIIIGSRRRDEREDFDAVYIVFNNVYNNGDIIVSGGCPKGGDRFAEMIARRIGSTEQNGQLIIHRPQPVPKGSPRWAWAKAYYDRNTLVAKEAERDSVIIACVSEDRLGGTEDTLKKAIIFDKIDLDNIILVRQ